jgi:hypothetical protein
MKTPSTSDYIVKVRAYLTDETFGYTHWRAAQFCAPEAEVERHAALIIFETKNERDKFVEEHHGKKDSER